MSNNKFTDIVLTDGNKVVTRAKGRLLSNYSGETTSFVVMKNQVEYQYGKVTDVGYEIMQTYVNYTLKELMIELNKKLEEKNSYKQSDYFVFIETKVDEHTESIFGNSEEIDNYKVKMVMEVEF